MLNNILLEEISIFKKFNSFEYLSDNAIVFAAYRSSLIKHWNVVYPLKPFHEYTKQEIDDTKTFFRKNRVDGYVICTQDRWSRVSIEDEEYFYLNANIQDESFLVDIGEFSASVAERLRDFYSIVKSAFNLDKKTASYFQQKMKLLASEEGSRFWIVCYGNEPCGCASTFSTKSNHNFLFNVAVLPKYQSKHIGSKMIYSVVRSIKKPVYTYSPNPIMRTFILPKVGFKSAGCIYKIRIKDYEQHLNINSE